MKISEIRFKSNIPSRGIDPAKAHETLEKVRKANHGLTDDLVIQAAKPKSSPIHKWFDWDDTHAANEHRRSQARTLLRAIEVVYEERPKEPSRVFEVERKEPTRTEARTVYNTTEEIMANPESRDKLVSTALAQLMAVRRRFRNLYELSHVFAAIDAAVEEVAKAE